MVCVWSYGAQSLSLIAFDFQLFKHITMTRQTLNPNCITLIVCQSCCVTDESTKTHTRTHTQSLMLPNSHPHPSQCFGNTLICLMFNGLNIASMMLKLTQLWTQWQFGPQVHFITEISDTYHVIATDFKSVLHFPWTPVTSVGQITYLNLVNIHYMLFFK